MNRKSASKFNRRVSLLLTANVGLVLIATVTNYFCLTPITYDAVNTGASLTEGLSPVEKRLRRFEPHKVELPGPESHFVRNTEVTRNLLADIDGALSRDYSNGRLWYLRAVLSNQIQETTDSVNALKNAEKLLVRRKETLPAIATLWSSLGRDDFSLNAYSRLLASHPSSVFDTVPKVLELHGSAQQLVDAMLPSDVLWYVPEEYLPIRVFRQVLDSDREDLIDVVWNHSSKYLVNDEAVVRKYANRLLGSERLPRLRSVLSESVGYKVHAGVINNGNFESEIGNLPMLWEINKSPSAEISRVRKTDQTGDQAILQIQFNGNTNEDFHHLSQKIFFNASGRYELTGKWKGEGVLNRSGLYFSLRNPAFSAPVQSEKRSGSWDWTTFRIDFPIELAVESTGQWSTLFLRLDASNDPIDKIVGTVQLDSIRLRRIGSI